MKLQIIHNSLEDANAEVSLLLSKIKDSLDKNTTSYNKVVKHPTKKLYATRYLVDGEYWEIVKKHLTTKQLDSLVEISNDWILKQEEIL